MTFNIQQILADSGALLDGHFLLTSGRHSDRYIEKFRLLEQPRPLDLAAQAMVSGIDPADVDVVLGAAVGGILLAGAVSRLLDKPTMFTERINGTMVLRRGFKISPNDRVLIVEDIVSTGGSIVELIDVVHQAGATVVEASYLVDRSPDGLELGVPSRALLRMSIDNWSPTECPLCAKNQPLTQRGRSGK